MIEFVDPFGDSHMMMTEEEELASEANDEHEIQELETGINDWQPKKDAKPDTTPELVKELEGSGLTREWFNKRLDDASETCTWEAWLSDNDGHPALYKFRCGGELTIARQVIETFAGCPFCLRLIDNEAE